MKRTMLAALSMGICLTVAACGDVQDVDTGCKAGTHADSTGACVNDNVADAGNTADAGSDDAGPDAGTGTTLPSWCFDEDQDGFPKDHVTCVNAGTQPVAYARADAPVDCNDSPVNGRTVNPGQSEIAGNGINDDCNDATSDTASSLPDDTCAYDQDGDGFSLAGAATYKVAANTACPSLYHKVRTDGKIDCVDTDAAVNPAVTEVTGNGKDDDCSAATPDSTTPAQDTCVYDQDGDGYQLANAATYQVAAGAACPSAYTKARTDGKIDCVDTDAAVNPGKTEQAGNGKDDDCSAATPDSTTSTRTYCPDLDNDSYPLGGTNCLQALSAPVNYIEPRADGKIDCVDTDAVVNPGKTEVTGNGKDDDCSAATPDVVNSNTELCVRDADADGYPKANPATADTKTVTTGSACESGYIKNRADGKVDCNDDPSNGGAAINPGATEICDGKDNNCAGGIDEGFNIGGQCDGRYGLCAVRGTLECSTTTQVRCSVDVGGSQSRVQTEVVGNTIDEDCDGIAQQSPVQTTTVTDGFRYAAPGGYVVLNGTISQCADQACLSFTGSILAGTASGGAFMFSQVRPRGQGTRYYRVNVNLATSAGGANVSWSCLGGGTVNGTFDATGSVGAALTTPVGTVSNGGGGCENVLRFQDN